MRPEVYPDETSVSKNHPDRFTWYSEEDGPEVCKPSGRGERLIIVNAITTDGWVSNAESVFEARKKTGDYHGQMDRENFSGWFAEQLLPNIPKNSVIITDNAGYHNVAEENSFPMSDSTKEDLRKWSDDKDIPWGQDLLKAGLYALCRSDKPKPGYKTDIIAKAAGHAILRTPQYHPELRPIEKCRGVVKNHMAKHCDFSLRTLRNNLPSAFSQVTSETCRKVIAKIVTEEDKYRDEDGKIDENQDVDIN